MTRAVLPPPPGISGVTMQLLSGDLGPTATYSRREYRALLGLGWQDGRDATVWFEHWHAKRRRNTKTRLSRYGVSEVKEVGFMGRAFVFDKEFGEEYEEADRKPPYTVRLDQHGSASCTCMADTCHAPTCRHQDCVLVLLEQGAFDQEIQGY